MQKPLVTQAISVGFKATWKKLWFFVLATLLSLAIGFGGFILAILAAIPFLIPLIAMVGKIKAAFIQLVNTTGAQVKLLAQGAEKTKSVFAALSGGLKLVADFFKSAFGIVALHPSFIILIILAIIAAVFVFAIVHNIIYLGWVRISLDMKEKGESSLGAAFSPDFSLAFRAVFAGLLSKLIAASPFLFSIFIAFIARSFIALYIFFLLSIPLSIYFSLKFFFCKFFILDQDAGVIESIKKSFNFYGAPSRLILLWLIYIAFYIGLGFVMAIFKVFPGSLGDFFSFIVRMGFSFFTWAVGWLVLGYIYKGLLEKGREL